MSTKRSPAQSPAKMKQETPAPRFVPERHIPQTIDLIADAVSEMLTTGTNEQSLDNLLIAALEHIARRTFERGIGVEDQNAVQNFVQREIKDYLRPWKIDIMAQWRHNRRESPAAIEPKTVTERIRLNAREVLEEYMDQFLGIATPEEVRFLIEVMINRESGGSISPTLETAEMPLGQAFVNVLRTGTVYLAVPERLSDQVNKYLSALRAIEVKAVMA